MTRCPIMSGTIAPCFSAKRQKLRRKLAHHIAVERHNARDPEAVEDREQQQWIVRRLSQRFSLFDQQTCPLRSRLGLRSGISFDMDEWGYERDLKLDLFATQRGAWRARPQSGRERELSCAIGFNQCRALQRPLPCLAPQARGLLDLSGLRAVARQQFGLALGNLGELAFEGFGDPGVKRPSRFAQQSAISRVLHQRVLEQISRVRRHTLPKQQTCRNETVERPLKFRLACAATAANRA